MLDIEDLFDHQDAEDDIAPSKEASTEEPVSSIPATELEDQFIWKLALKYQIIGIVSPTQGKGRGSNDPLVYDFTMKDSQATKLLNEMLDRTMGIAPKTVNGWRAFIAKYTANPPRTGKLRSFDYEPGFKYKKTPPRKVPKTPQIAT